EPDSHAWCGTSDGCDCVFMGRDKRRGGKLLARIVPQAGRKDSELVAESSYHIGFIDRARVLESPFQMRGHHLAEPDESRRGHRLAPARLGRPGRGGEVMEDHQGLEATDSSSFTHTSVVIEGGYGNHA